MSARRVVVPVVAFLLLLSPAFVAAQDAAAPLPLDDFETDPQHWTYIGGQEFPGAQGALTLDDKVAHAGKRSYRLDADFKNGGAYVGTWTDLAAMKGRDFKEIRLWVKSSHVTEIGVRLADSSQQIHQKKNVKLKATADWQEVVLKIADLVGEEHWGGANDGKWHGPATAFGLNVGKNSIDEAGQSRGALWLDDVTLTPGSAVAGRPTLHTAVVKPERCRPGFASAITYRWDAEPMGKDFSVFVHFTNAQGQMVFQSDHETPVGTAVWSGKVEYTHKVFVPIDTPTGDYKIVLGLYDRRAGDRGWDHQPLQLGPGVPAPADAKEHRYQIGVLKVDADAPPPPLPAPTLKLDDYEVTFVDDFNELSVSESGPNTRWFTATKGQFGDAQFVPQKDGFPFSVSNGILRIEAAKRNGRWQGGIMASADPQGGGFSQKYGYFEMRAKFPKSRGMWPAFWLLGQPSLTNKKLINPEIDVVEHYGVMPNSVMSTTHLWHPDGKHTGVGDFITAPGLTDEFHNYGVLVDESHITYYFDGIETLKQETPDAAKVPLYLIVDLAMGGGWPIDKAESPSYMYVDYVKAWQKKR